MYITFVVKGFGHSFEAIEHGISPVRLVAQTNRESVYRTTYDNLAQVAAWFADTPNLIPGFGYPDGTCLIYSIHPEEGGAN